LSFGLSIALAGLIPHKPFIEDRPYSELLDQLHSACASLGGFSAVAEFALQAVQSVPVSRKLIYAAIAVAYTLLPVAMFLYPAYQGVLQRAIFGSFILWVLIDRPAASDGQRIVVLPIPDSSGRGAAPMFSLPMPYSKFTASFAHRSDTRVAMKGHAPDTAMSLS
jgi:hypothetical protein